MAPPTPRFANLRDVCGCGRLTALSRFKAVKQQTLVNRILGHECSRLAPGHEDTLYAIKTESNLLHFAGTFEGTWIRLIDETLDDCQQKIDDNSSGAVLFACRSSRTASQTRYERRCRKSSCIDFAQTSREPTRLMSIACHSVVQYESGISNPE